MKRPTIRDIAREAQVSAGAVSFALNGRPGVSETTRERILEVADRLGWRPSAAALALSGRRAGAVGLVVARPSDTLSTESFYLQFIAGIERVLTARSMALVLQFVDDVAAEIEVYKRWWSENRVDGVLVTDPRTTDPRFEALADHGIPAVAVGGTHSGPRLASITTSDADAMQLIVEHLTSRGHKHISYVAGFPELLHVDQRVAAFQRSAHAVGATAHVVNTDYTEDAGRSVTQQILGSDKRPTAVVFDNEILAVGGLDAVEELDLTVPDDVAFVSWEDSFVCRMTRPPLTALRRDPAQLGDHAATLLLNLIDDKAEGTSEQVPELIVRRSTFPLQEARTPAHVHL